jgi:hypothetical protein
MWGSALTAAYAGTGIAIVERPVVKANASGTGLLDLWMGIHEIPYVFDYGIEAKPDTICTFNDPHLTATKLFNIAITELTAARQANGIAKYDVGATVGIISQYVSSSPPSSTIMDQFIDDVWGNLGTLAGANTMQDLRLVFGTHKFPSPGFNIWKKRIPLGAYALFIAYEC